MPTPNQIRESITNQIVTALESGDIPPWRQPWVGNGLPTNVVSKRRYTGVNILLLQLHMLRHRLTSNRFATFRQWQDLGCRVKPRPSNVPPGQWACTIVFYRMVEKTEVNDAGAEEPVRYPILRTYQVFSASQVSGPDMERFEPQDRITNPAFVDYGPAEEAVAATEADIRLGGDSAYYVKPMANGEGDYICCPRKSRFSKANSFYATLLHELGHWSESRLGWEGSYAEGELRAEITSAFALSELSVPQSDDLSNCQSYVASWLRALRENPRFIFKVSSDASRACDYLLDFSRERVEEAEAAIVI